MIGIDIVDLTDPLLKPRTWRELGFIRHPLDHCPYITDINVRYWAFWSAKEAVFKAHRLRQQFRPNDISVHYHSNGDGRLHFQAKWITEVTGYTMVGENELLSISTKTDAENIAIRRYALASNNPSKEIREQFSEEMQKGYRMDADENDLPAIRSNDKSLPASISHHHRLGALAWLRNEQNGDNANNSHQLIKIL